MSRTVTNKFGDEYTYDDNGNLIHVGYFDGFEEWFDRDDHGNCIHFKDSDGHEEWYDANGVQISKEEFDKL